MAKALKVCSRAGCPNLTRAGLCTACRPAADQARGRRQARGYNRAHELERERWRPAVEAGRIDCRAPTCVMPDRRIRAGQAWDLGHTDDRKTWRGPEHAPCNRGWRRNQ